MAFFNNNWSNVALGAQANDGTGDPIRTAFGKVDTQMTYLGQILSQTSQDFLNANIQYQFNATTANITNSFLANATGTTGAFTGNFSAGNLTAVNYSTANNLVANSTLYVGGTTTVNGNILPTITNTYNLGSPSQQFGNIYVQTVNSSTQVTQSSDAGILLIHANSAGNSDVGILGNVTDHDSDIDTSGPFMFFGYELASDNFVYKFTPNNATTGNNVVINSTYGGAHFATLLLSNTDVSTSTSTGALQVAGGAGIVGNLYAGGNLNVTGNASVSGNLYAGGYQVLTTATSGLSLYSGGSAFTSAITTTAAIPSTSTSTGAIVVSYGGMGVGGNVWASGFNGQVYGAQSHMDSLTIPTINTTTIGGTTGTFTSISVGTITGLTSLTTTANISVGNLSVAQVDGTTLGGTLITASQPNITNLSNVVATNFSTGNALISGGSITGGNISGITSGAFTMARATNFSSGNVLITGGSATSLANVAATTIYGNLVTATQANITAVGNLTSLSVAGNINLNGSLNANTNVVAAAVYTNNYRWANGASFVSMTIANTTEITGNVSSGPTGLSLTTTGVTAGNFGNATSIPTIVVDSKGRITSVTANSVSTTISLSGTSGTGSVAGGGTLTFAGSYGVTASASGSTITIGTSQDLQTTASPVHAGLNVTGIINAATVKAGTIGNASAVLYGTLNAFSGSQTNITAVGTLTGLTVSGDILATSGNAVNIGSTTNWFNNIYGTAIHSLYADLAENYAGDAEYEPGTVVVFGGKAEITVTNQFADVSVAGAISTNPAYLMNDGESGLPVALRGRVPVKVIGPVRKGDLLVTAGQNPGYATSVGKSTEHPLAVFAKAIETNTDEGAKVITAVIL